MAGSVEARCPIRVGDPCSMCHPGASDPDSCGLVYLVMSDPELREELLRRWEQWRQEQAVPGQPGASVETPDRPVGGCCRNRPAP